MIRGKGIVCFQKLMMQEVVIKLFEFSYNVWKYSFLKFFDNILILDILFFKLNELIFFIEVIKINY